MEKHALSPTDLDLIKKYLVAGASVGGSAALFTSLLNQLNDIKEQDKNPLDSNTLKLVVKNPNAAEKEKSYKMASAEEDTSIFRGPLAMAGGVLSTIGSYALVRHLYQKLKEKQLERELEQAQDKYVTGLQQSNEPVNKKNASEGKPMGMLEALTSAPLAASLLLALGSGVVSYNALKKSFPDLKRGERERLGPKRVQVVYDNPGDEPDTVVSNIPVEALEKTAAANAFLINTVAGFGGASDVADVVHTVANGFGNQVKDIFAFEGINSVFEKCANTQTFANDLESVNLAANWCARSPGIAPGLAVVAAAEFANKAPLFFKAATSLPEHIQEALVDLVVKTNSKVAAGVVDKIKEVELIPQEEDQNGPEAPSMENGAEKLDPQDLLEMLLAAKAGHDMDPAAIADLQTEDSEEAGQE